MTLSQLQYFMEIVKTRNFTVAANNLYVSQSSLSYAIRELENELETQLFIRRPNKGIELTMYGEALLPYAEEGLRLIEEGKNRVISMKSPLHGKVRLAFFHSIVFSAIPALMQQFREDNPGSEIEFETLVFHGWADFRQLLLDGKCDLVFSAGNIGNGCESIQIAKHRIFLLVSSDHPLAAKDKVTVEDLADVQLFQIDPGSNMDQRIRAMFDNSDIVPRIRYTTDWTTQQLAVLNGKGVGLTCDVASDERYLCKIPVDSEYATMPLYLTWATRQKLSGAATLLRDYYLELAERSGDTLIF